MASKLVEPPDWVANTKNEMVRTVLFGPQRLETLLSWSPQRCECGDARSRRLRKRREARVVDNLGTFVKVNCVEKGTHVYTLTSAVSIPFFEPSYDLMRHIVAWLTMPRHAPVSPNVSPVKKPHITAHCGCTHQKCNYIRNVQNHHDAGIAFCQNGADPFTTIGNSPEVYCT